MKFNHLNRAIPGLIVVLVLTLSGCREQSPSLRIQAEGADGIQSTSHAQAPSATEPKPEVMEQINANTQVVTGVPATAEDKEDKPTDGKTAEDKTGAVAVQMQY